MQRSASMVAGLARVKKELPDDPQALEEMIQDIGGSRDSSLIFDRAVDTYHARSRHTEAFEQNFRQDLQLELTADNVLPDYPASPAPTLPATDTQLLVAGRQTPGPSCRGSETWLSLYSRVCLKGCRYHVLRKQLKLTMASKSRRMYIWLGRMMKTMLA